MLNNFSPDQFLTEYWQKQPLFMPSAIDVALPTLEANELGWLATQPDVESRLVFTKRAKSGVTYLVEHGPFATSHLRALPSEDWTLLVQDVEKHLPDFRIFFGLVPFIPSWRIDDLMVSIAAPGGSVGPHKDNYDVFLCQGVGKRNWSLTTDRAVPANASAESLSLLRPFEPSENRNCETGDVLYVPPGIPHWGIAKTFCTTYSIGMRAPNGAELAAGLSRIIDTDAINPAGEACFYTDPDLRSCEADDGQISIETLRRLRQQDLLDSSLSDEQLVTVLGSVMTDPKAWLDPDRPGEEEINNLLTGTQDLRVHGMTLITWYECDDLRIVFVNGSARNIPESGTALVRALCVDRFAPAELVRLQIKDPEGLEFVGWLLDQGLLDTG